MEQAYAKQIKLLLENDKIDLDKSVLSGTYTYTQQDNDGGGPTQGTQVPEPSTIALVGFGLAAIGLYRGRQR